MYDGLATKPFPNGEGGPNDLKESAYHMLTELLLLSPLFSLKLRKNKEKIRPFLYSISSANLALSLSFRSSYVDLDSFHFFCSAGLLLAFFFAAGSARMA